MTTTADLHRLGEAHPQAVALAGSLLRAPITADLSRGDGARYGAAEDVLGVATNADLAAHEGWQQAEARAGTLARAHGWEHPLAVQARAICELRDAALDTAHRLRCAALLYAAEVRVATDPAADDIRVLLDQVPLTARRTTQAMVTA